jgi:hypothetical protein
MRRIALAVLVLAVLVLAPAASTDAQEHPKRLKQMLLILEDRLVNVHFKEKPLAEIVSYFSTLTGVNLVVSPVLLKDREEEELRVTLTLKKLSVASVLRIILDLKGLAAVYRHGVIMITTPKDARGKPRLKIYSIADLTFKIRDFPAPDLMLKPHGVEDWGDIGGGEEVQEHSFADPELIMDLIRDNTGKDTWEDEGVSLSGNDRYLVVRQYPTVHREIAGLLELLRGFR